MMWTIKRRMYVVGLLPLALLAVTLVAVNGITRIRETDQELRNAQRMTAALLQSAALDALKFGNVRSFEQSVDSVIKSSPALICVTLRDPQHEPVAHAGTCGRPLLPADYFPIAAPSGGFSDFKELPAVDPAIGELGILMDDATVVHKRHQVILQLLGSLALIGAVLASVGWLLRARLIQPIQRIGAALRALNEHNYEVRVPIEGHDELTQHAQDINNALETIQAYTAELEKRTHDADDVTLALAGLVRSLTENLEGPIGRMHLELTEIAIANRDPELKGRIKAVIASLQAAQSDFADLIDIGTSAQDAKQPPTRDLADIMADIQRDMGALSKAEGVEVHFDVAQRGEGGRIFLDVDGVRLKKVLMTLIRAMARRCTKHGVYLSVELIKISDQQLHVSLHLKAFYEPGSRPPAMPWLKGLGREGNIERLIGLTDRETKVVDYLLRIIGIAPIVSDSPGGAVTVLLETTCHYSAEQNGRKPATEKTYSNSPISTALVSNDAALGRLTTFGDMSNLEVKLVPFSRALADLSSLRSQHAVLIDMTDNIAEAQSFVDRLKSEGINVPMIAICPPGRMGDPLKNRLFEMGFAGTVQKPLHYSRLIEVIRSALSPPLR